MKDLLKYKNAWDKIGEAMAELKARIWTTKEGVMCPVCGRSAKVTRGLINLNQIRAMFWLYHNTRRGEFIHFNDRCPKRKLVTSASFGKLKHWGLVAQMPNEDDPTKNKSGYVMITDAGRIWLEDKGQVNKIRFIYNDQCLGEEGPMVGIRDYEAKDFHYENEIKTPARPA